MIINQGSDFVALTSDGVMLNMGKRSHGRYYNNDLKILKYVLKIYFF